MTITKKLFTITSALIINAAFAQQYDDVAVIINSNSLLSDSIGTYFAQQRAIPADNIIRISAPVQEEIDSTQFENLRAQVENGLTRKNIIRRINYLVTTKGMPLKVNRGNTFSPTSPSSSVESELTLILGPYASNIGCEGRFFSPYYNVQKDFTRKEFGFFLVTRLDGYTFSDIKNMIDRAASIDSAIFNYGRFVFDADPTRSMVIGSLNGYMKSAAYALQPLSANIVFDSTTTFVTHIQNVLGYVSWGSNDANQHLYTDNAKPYHEFLPGSLAETYVSTSARSFSNPPQYGQSLIADLIAEGVNGVKGYVYEPYTSSMANVGQAFPMYVSGFTMAESYYSASAYLSWMDVVIGDPKMRISNVRISGNSNPGNGNNNGTSLPVELISFRGMVQGISVKLEWKTATEVNNHGFIIEKRTLSLTGAGQDGGQWTEVGFVQGHGTTNSANDYTFIDKTAKAGTYEYRLKQIDNDGAYEYSKTISVEVAMNSQTAGSLKNYPNPFNPVTTINVEIPQDDQVSVKIYDITGREVATLLDGKASAGTQSLTFNAAHLASGIYFARLQTSTTTVTHKMNLMK